MATRAEERHTRFARAREWGTTEEMNPLEAMMWRAEGDPRMRVTLAGVNILDRSPDWDRLRDAHDWATRMVPRFRQRVVEPALGVGAPSWQVDPEFQLDRHLRRVQAPAPGDLRALLDLAAEVMMAPFDRDRPLWEAVLVEGLDGGQAAYILKLHHSITDGLGNVQLLDMLHSDRRRHDPHKPQPPVPVANGNAPALLLGGQLVRTISAVPGAALQASRQALGRLGGAAVHPRGALIGAARAAASLEHVATAPGTAPSPLLAPRSLRWRLEAVEVPLADLRSAAKATRASLNDVYLAAVLGALRLYHEEFGIPLDEVPMAIPVSVRSDDDPLGGNRFTGLRFAGPAGEVDVRRRISLVREVVRRERAEPAVDVLAELAPLIGLLPGRVVSRLAVRLTPNQDVQASNVPGISRRVYMAGAEIVKVYPFAPLPGCAAMITMVSHNEHCCVGANLDAAAFTEPELFAKCLSQALDEVIALTAAGTPARST
ncbi:MAG: WS/DGAT domain-containing protein [Actinomycetota bacterium]|nr:WS/DGAT domain-containing protein [Actinomycetota bacterium]